MKSLYESILGTNKADLASQVHDWMKSVVEYNSDICDDIKVTVSNGRFDILLVGRYLGYIRFDKDYLKNGDFPFPIGKISSSEREYLVIAIRECDITSFKNFPQNKSIRFFGCDIEDLSDLPKTYDTVSFQKMNSLSGGKSCKIGKCKGIKVDHWLSNGEGYKMVDWSKFKNNTIKDFCMVAPYLNNAFDKALNDAIANNNIDPKNITVMKFNAYDHHKINKFRVEKKKVDGEMKYVCVGDRRLHQEIYND